ncbi:MAG: hypothetical protein ACFCAD_03200 [Pleurocapsa sp.]
MAQGFGEASVSLNKSSKSSSQMITFDDEQVQKQWVEHFADLTVGVLKAFFIHS